MKEPEGNEVPPGEINVSDTTDNDTPENEDEQTGVTTPQADDKGDNDNESDTEVEEIRKAELGLHNLAGELGESARLMYEDLRESHGSQEDAFSHPHSQNTMTTRSGLSSVDMEEIMSETPRAGTKLPRNPSSLLEKHNALLAASDDIETGGGLFDEVDREEELRLKEEWEEEEKKRRQTRRSLGAAFEKYDTTMVRSDSFSSRGSTSSHLSSANRQESLSSMSKPVSFRLFRIRNVQSKAQLQEKSKIRSSNEDGGNHTLSFKLKKSLENSKSRKRYCILMGVVFMFVTLTVIVILLVKIEPFANAASMKMIRVTTADSQKSVTVKTVPTFEDFELNYSLVGDFGEI